MTETKRRVMRPMPPAQPGDRPRYDIYISNWVSTNYGGEHPGRGYWSETRRGRVEQDGGGDYRAWYMVGDNPQVYPIEGTWPTAKQAAVAVDEYAIEQGRIGNEQVAYQRSHGWSID